MNTDQKPNESSPVKPNNNRLALIVSVAFVAIAISFGLILANQSKPVVQETSPTHSSALHPQANFNNEGDPNAPVKIVEYSDFQCPYCAQFSHETEPKIVENYINTGKVYFTSRSMGNWVSGNINKRAGTQSLESQTAAMAAYCAADQSKYWEFRDLLFASQNGENEGAFNRDKLDGFAQTLGLDLTTFKACMDTSKYAVQVAQDALDGKQSITSAPNYDGNGIGTPAFLINGQVILGAQSYEVFQKEIEAALAATGK